MARRLRRLFPPQSGVFITLHKCASLFFSQQFLPNLQDLVHVDFQWQHYENRLRDPIEIRRRGHIYGPVRILDDKHPSYGLTEDILSACLRAGLKTIVFVRDPRDILVSMYYSFGFSHPLSPQPDIREYQLRRSSWIQSMDVNAYAMHEAPVLLEKFSRISAFCLQAKDRIILHYEEMIRDFACFHSRLDSFVRIREGMRDTLYRQTRPEETENSSRHKRLGEPGEFRKKLCPESIRELNELFSRVLADFRYETKDG